MDTARFDRLATLVSRATTRRTVVGLVAALGTLLGASRPETASKPKPKHKPKKS
jgi:hypothetical protein